MDGEIRRLLDDMNRAWQDYDALLTNPRMYPQPQQALAMIEASAAFTDACWRLEARGIHWHELAYDKESKTFALPATLTTVETSATM